MQTMRNCIINRKILAILLTLLLTAGVLCLGSSHAEAKGSISPDDYVKNVLIYVKNSAGEEVLISQLNVSDMLTYLNDNFETYGKIHNYSILDSYVTPVHQEAQGFTVNEMLDYAVSKSTLENIKSLGLGFSGNDSVSFWEIDGNGFDAIDTYTHDSLYGVTRYNFPALYGSWDYDKHAYADKDAIWASRQEEQVVLSITAYSQRYIVSDLCGTGEYNMENYFDGQGLLDTARTVRLMLPMTEDEFENQTSTAMNSRWGICYILFNMENVPDFSKGTVAKPTYTVIDGDKEDGYEAGYWYFTLSCATEGATIYYNDNSVSSYMPTAVYTPGQKIKVKKSSTTASTLKIRAVKEGYTDAGIQTASSDQSSQEEDPEEEDDPIISFKLTPADATVVVRNSGGTEIPANPDGTYTLIPGETYTYEVTAEGYLTRTDSFTVTGSKVIRVALNKEGKVVTDGPSQIILSWTDNPSTTQSVIWCDNSGNEGYVQYVAEDSYMGESSFSSDNQVQATSKTVGYDSAAKTYYEATMTGLAPGATYYYRVGSSDNWSDVTSFTTAPSSTSSFSFMYMGDVQHNTTAAAEYPIWGSLLTDAYTAHPNITFGLMGGDMVQSGSDMNDWTYFLSYAGDVFSRIPLMTTIGNHESNFTGGKAKFYMDILALPPNGPAGFEEEFYSFDYGTVHVTVLNSWALSNEQKLNEAQKKAISDWITADLAAAVNAKFRIVLLHHPAYALAPDTVSGAVLANWVPLWEAGHVDLVLCGHQHVYSRSYPLLAGEIDYVNGITYVMGNSGQKFYSTADTTYSEKTIFSKSTYQLINVNGDTLSLSTYDSDGNLLDAWSTTSQSTTLVGDVNGDGVVDMDDVNAVYRAVLNCDDYNSIMDINDDGIVDMRDTQLVLKIYLNAA